jgi:hypothetical protein
MGFRSYYFAFRHVVVQNYGPALISQDRITITRIVFVAPHAARPFCGHPAQFQ